MRDMFKVEGINQTPEQVCLHDAIAKCIGWAHHWYSVQTVDFLFSILAVDTESFAVHGM